MFFFVSCLKKVKEHMNQHPPRGAFWFLYTKKPPKSTPWRVLVDFLFFFPFAVILWFSRVLGGRAEGPAILRGGPTRSDLFSFFRGGGGYEGRRCTM